MSARILGSTTKRILSQLRHDHRTVGLLVVVPVVLLTLLYFMFEQAPGVFDGIGLIMLGVFPFVIMFLITSIAMLRERTTGTLERLLTTPLGKMDLLFAYGIAFGDRRRHPGDGGLRRRVLALRPGHGWPDGAGHPHRDRQRGARRRARPVVQRVRPDRVPGRAVHAHRGAARRSCCAGSSWRATRWPVGCRRSAT